MGEPAISLSDFAFHSKVRIEPGKDWPRQLFLALQSKLQLKGTLAAAYGHCNEPRTAGTYAAGLNVIKVAKKKRDDMPVHDVQVSYAAFDESGQPVSWSADFDREFPTKTTLSWQASNNRPVVLTDEQRRRAKALAPPGGSATKSKARAKSKGRGAKGKPKPPARPGHDALVLAMAFSPDGAALLSSGEDGSLRCWDAATGKRKASHRLGSRLHHFAIHPTADRVVAASAKLIVLDPDTGDRLQSLSGHGMNDADSIVFLAPDRVVSTSCIDVTAWDAQGGERLAKVKLPDQERFLAGSPDGTRVALVHPHSLEIRNANDLTVQHEIVVESERLGHIVVWCDAGIWLRRERIRHTTVGMDKDRTAVAAIEVLSTRVELLEPTTLEVLRTIDHDVDAISPDGRFALVVDGAKATVLALLDDASPPLELALPEAADRYACAIAPRGQHIAVGHGPDIFLLHVPALLD